MSRRSSSTAGEIALLALAYFVAAKFGLSLAYLNVSASAVWPPTGIALATLLMRGNRLWPGVFFGAFLANLTTAGTLLTSLAIATGNTLEAVVGTWLVTRLAGGTKAFESVQSILAFVGCAILSTAISASIGIVSLGVGGLAATEKLGAIWLTWWMGDLVSDLTVAPLLLIWFEKGFRKFDRHDLLELAFVAAIVLIVGEIVFNERSKPYPLTFLALPPLIWAAYRFRQRGAVTANFLMSLIAIEGTIHDTGPFTSANKNESLLLLEAFMGTIGLTGLCLAALVAESKVARESCAQLAAIVESSQEAIIGKTLDGIVNSWNHGAERLYGYTAAEMISKSISTIIPPQHQHELLEINAKLTRGERIEPFETVRLRKDGKRLHVLLTISPIKNNAGIVIGASAATLDITEKKRAEEQAGERLREEAALRASEARFHELAEAAPLIIYTAKPDGIIDYANQRWYEYTGLTEEQSLSLDGFLTAVHPDDLATIIEKRAQSLRTGWTLQTEFRLRGKSGDYNWFLSQATAIKSSQGKLLRWVGTCTDINDRKRAADDLQQIAIELEAAVSKRTAELEESVKFLENFLYVIGHHLRAPLRAMDGFTKVLLEDYAKYFDDAGKENAQRIVTAAGRMHQLINALLYFGRLSHEEFPCQGINVGARVNHVLHDFAEEIQKKGAEVTVHRPLPEIWANPVAVDQILKNLIGNALKFVSPTRRPCVEIWATETESSVRLFIKDNGIGIQPAHQTRIFDLFEKLSDLETYPGIGVGLAIVRKTAERMNGSVGVESEPGIGSTFWVELPAPFERATAEEDFRPEHELSAHAHPV